MGVAAANSVEEDEQQYESHLSDSLNVHGPVSKTSSRDEQISDEQSVFTEPGTPVAEDKPAGNTPSVRFSQVMPIGMVATATDTNNQKRNSPTSLKYSQVMPVGESKKNPKSDGKKHAPLLKRSSSELAMTQEHREEALARQVLWMALITHMGKRNKMNVSAKQICVVGPNVIKPTYTLNDLCFLRLGVCHHKKSHACAYFEHMHP